MQRHRQRGLVTLEIQRVPRDSRRLTDPQPGLYVGQQLDLFLEAKPLDESK